MYSEFMFEIGSQVQTASDNRATISSSNQTIYLFSCHTPTMRRITMFRKLTVFICLLSLSPAAGAQDLALLVVSQPAQRSADSAPAREINLSPPVDRGPAVLVAAGKFHG